MSRMKVMAQKQKILLLVLDEIGKFGIKSKTYLEKVLFLLKMEGNLDDKIKFYSFYPYKYGPFSSVSYGDWNKLENQGFVTDEWAVTNKGKVVIESLEKSLSQSITGIITQFDSAEKIRSYVYRNYPEYTVKSELVHAEKKSSSPGIFTIGYEGRDIDEFLDALIKNQIGVVIDIRNNPFSMSFNYIQSRLRSKLQAVNINYVHIGSLGIEGELRKNLDSEEDYRALFANYRSRIKEENVAEIAEIIMAGKSKRIALLCFEKDKNMCHRGIVADEIEKQGVKVTHL